MTAAVPAQATTLPHFHLRPQRGWLNDPNGMVRRDDRWHVFFQHNPEGPVHDRIHWGHMSSPDLVTWTEHPVAFGPTPGGPDEFGCWSGVFVPGLDRPAMAYSGLVDETQQSTVCLRWGSDDLMTWEEPIVVGATPRGAGVRVMRDPFVFQHGGRRWAVLGAGLDDGTPAVLLYSCDDILAWRFEEVWLSHRDVLLRDGAPADIWECPQLGWADGVPILLLSLQLDGKLGDVVAAVGTVTEDGEGRPRFAVEGVQRIDDGTSFYAPQLVQDGASPLMFGWVREAAHAPGGRTVAGCLTLPRRLSVVDGRVRVRADDAVAVLAAPGGGAMLEPGEHLLPEVARLEVVDSGASGQGWLLSGADEPVAAPLPDGTTIWLDVDVAEVYPGDGGMPMTLRRKDPRWRLAVPADGRAVVSAVVPPSRG